MKVLSVKQPWATLIALGLKPFEIRSRPTHYRGPLAIHASSRSDTSPEAIAAADRAGLIIADLPLGRVVAIVHLDGCRRYEPEDTRASLSPWHPDHWAWILTRVRKATSPFPVKGRLGIWELPDAAIEVQA